LQSHRMSRQTLAVVQSQIHDRLGGDSRPILSRRPEVRVGVKRRGRLGVSEGALHGDDVAACGDEAGGVEVSEVVELDAA
jgi:hypothetical protein